MTKSYQTRKYNKGEILVRGGITTSYSGTYDNLNRDEDTYDPRKIDDTSIRRILDVEGQKGLYELRRYELRENPWFEFVVNHVVTKLANFYFDGPGAEKMNEFFDDVCPTARQEIRIALESCVGNGTGFLLKFRDIDGILRQIKGEDHELFELDYTHKLPDDISDRRNAELDENARTSEKRWLRVRKELEEGDVIDYYLREYPRLRLEDYQHKKLGVLRLLLDASSPYGKPIGQSSLSDIQGLKYINKDVLAALHRMVGLPVVAKVDTHYYNDEEKAQALKDVAESLKGINWMEMDVYSISNEHDIGFMGSLGNSPNDQRITDVMSHIEPILAAVLALFYVPLGLILQTGANKSLIAQQIMDSREKIRQLRDTLALWLKLNIGYDLGIDINELEVRFPPMIEYELLLNMFNSSAVSREFVHDSLSIADDGETFVPIDKQSSPKLGSDNDDGEGGKTPMNEEKGV